MKSNQAKAKAAQGYTEERKTCATCRHQQFDLVMPAWVEQYNKDALAQGREAPYGDAFLQKKKVRCGIGNFKIKVTATCARWEACDEKA